MKTEQTDQLGLRILDAILTVGLIVVCIVLFVVLLPLWIALAVLLSASNVEAKKCGRGANEEEADDLASPIFIDCESEASAESEMSKHNQ